MDQQQFEAMLSDVEIRLRRLKLLYDQYFAGFERVEPAVARKEVDDLLQRLRREQVRNTALRFRLQQVVQRHTTFTTHWRRITRQIEEGTYQRDVAKAKRLRSQLMSERESRETEISYDVDIDVDMGSALEDAMQAVATATQSVAARPPNMPSAAVSMAPGQPTSPAAASTPTSDQPELSRRPPPIPLGAAVPRPISPFALPLERGAKASLAPSPAQPLPAQSAPGKPPAPGVATSATRTAVSTGPTPAVTRPISVDRAAPANRPAQPTAASASAHKPAADNAALSTGDVQRIYAKYVAARQQNAERTDNVKLDTIERTLRGMLPQLEKKHAGKKIDFEVVVKDGKVALKPVAK